MDCIFDSDTCKIFCKINACILRTFCLSYLLLKAARELHYRRKIQESVENSELETLWKILESGGELKYQSFMEDAGKTAESTSAPPPPQQDDIVSIESFSWLNYNQVSHGVHMKNATYMMSRHFSFCFNAVFLFSTTYQLFSFQQAWMNNDEHCTHSFCVCVRVCVCVCVFFIFFFGGDSKADCLSRKCLKNLSKI